MAELAEWAKGYARQADADFARFQALQAESVPECHKLSSSKVCLRAEESR
jgi:hypothetical protein